MKHLILLDTDRVKDYVFGSYKLREVRGASTLLDYLNRSYSPKVLEQIEPGSTLYSHGGTTMGLFSTAEKAREGIYALENLYRHRSAGAASITGAQIEWNGENGKPFQDSRRELALKIRLAKEQRDLAAASPFSLSLLHFCQSCGGVPARRITPDDDRVLCEACAVKRKWSEYVRDKDKREGEIGWTDAFLDRLTRWLKKYADWQEESLDHLTPEDLNDIGEVSSPQNYIGFIYCDANNLGRTLQKPDAPETLKQLATDIDNTLHEAAFSAIASRLRPRPQRSAKVLPFEIVLLGGDDLVLITAADQALDVAAEIVQTFAKHIGDEQVSLSAGVVLAHASFPISSFFRLAEELLRSAKRRRIEQRWEGGAIDFAVVSSSGAQAVEVSRQEEWEASIGRSITSLTERPYPADQRDCRGHQPSFPDLLSAIRALKRADIPRSRLHYLYESLFASLTQTEVAATVATQEVMGRLSRAEARQSFRSILHKFSPSPPPWRDAGGGRRTTLWLDLIELWDFVPET